MLRRALLDMRMLHSRLDGDGYYAAGVPWYATLFGRDSLITARQLLAFDPPMAEQTLRVLARLIGDARRPGARRGAREGPARAARRGDRPARPLPARPLLRHGRRDAAVPLPADRLADWTGDLSLLRELRGEVDAMLGWIDGPGDRDGDGLLDYHQRAPTGLRNQGWKDSDEGVLDERGTPLEPPITLIEPQAYALRAKRRLARLLALDGDEPARRTLLAEAARARASGSSASGCPSRATTRWAGAPTAARARRSPPTRGTCSGALRCRRIARRRCATRSCPTRCSPAGGSARSPRPRPASTRSATTSARSGRTTRR